VTYSKNYHEWGVVIVLSGKYKGRIGYLEDEVIVNYRSYGKVYFASMLLSVSYCLIEMKNLDKPNTKQKFLRYEELFTKLSPYFNKSQKVETRISYLEELLILSNELSDKLFSAKFGLNKSGAKIFLSHSSLDKHFVRLLATDLYDLGHQPWLDEWEIGGGESIPEKLSLALESTDFLIVVLSENSSTSKWVEQEWQTKYWDEINSRKITVIPVLYSSCSIPTLLKTKKYIDFREDYDTGLSQLNLSLIKQINTR
jgi:TIR domain